MRVFTTAGILLFVVTTLTQAQNVGVLRPLSLSLGQKGELRTTDAKVIQVVDEYQMIVGLEENAAGKGRYNTHVWMKCSTKGITDGKFWNLNEWEARTGSRFWEVTDTKTYKTVGGGSKTVFVLEPWKKDKK